MDEKLLARLQKDLDGFTEFYDGQLNKTLATHAQNMQPLWKHVEESLLKRAKQLYGEADALDENLPPITRAEKFRALNYEAARLENLAADMAEDLKKAETQLQPYFTSNIAHEFEKGYYFTNWGTEQALKVAVQTPLLTPNRIYGVLANPWLPDGKTYSARLRMNTTYLAGKMRGTMAEATAYGWGWNETARRIQEVAQEGYFNAVRLARTEMVRASNLGASYSYMENSDILDGKRWNATLDTKTAPKDAANDGEIFDLDYDTPENPGIPGKRIPNHPNCRCRYTPVLSALGVQDKKGRISKDPVDKSREYFKGNYREYAKFHKLPDLDERLKAENPAKYLRPGEKLEDLNKQVVRRTINNREIAIPRPMWERLEKPPASIPQVVEPTAAINTVTQGVKELTPERIKDITGATVYRLNDISPDMAKEFNQGIAKTYETFPELKGFVSEFKSSTAGRSYASNSLKFIQNGATATIKDTINISKNLCGTADNFLHQLAGDIEIGFHPEGWSAQHIVAHELAHALEARLALLGENAGIDSVLSNATTGAVVRKLNRGTIADDIVSKALERLKIRRGELSWYGKYSYASPGEMFAQIVADGLVSEKPQPVAVEVLKIIRGVIAKGGIIE